MKDRKGFSLGRFFILLPTPSFVLGSSNPACRTDVHQRTGFARPMESSAWVRCDDHATFDQPWKRSSTSRPGNGAEGCFGACRMMAYGSQSRDEGRAARQHGAWRAARPERGQTQESSWTSVVETLKFQIVFDTRSRVAATMMIVDHPVTFDFDAQQHSPEHCFFSHPFLLLLLVTLCCFLLSINSSPFPEPKSTWMAATRHESDRPRTARTVAWALDLEEGREDDEEGPRGFVGAAWALGPAVALAPLEEPPLIQVFHELCVQAHQRDFLLVDWPRGSVHNLR